MLQSTTVDWWSCRSLSFVLINSSIELHWKDLIVNWLIVVNPLIVLFVDCARDDVTCRSIKWYRCFRPAAFSRQPSMPQVYLNSFLKWVRCSWAEPRWVVCFLISQHCLGHTHTHTQIITVPRLTVRGLIIQSFTCWWILITVLSNTNRQVHSALKTADIRLVQRNLSHRWFLAVRMGDFKTLWRNKPNVFLPLSCLYLMTM